ncbi:hypothetical protein PHLGIDRAFT_16153 [Phlebiopsis gigantea 11061_1 CR5-6]|uniref:Ion transport domain-containing protein n=1 Tax=Phlebiopsis gigantea (strain 11061_1 CR5-6) TaxID=745531 RepID=A0A0C3RRZ8_PHLG1|nr:hypothetical protein PHLGIDRAFT_16153 [Phlebiopsis gigantea 11061_1 CR5-6]
MKFCTNDNSQDVMHFIDTPLSLEALASPDLTYTLVRPLEDKYNALQRKGNLAVVFCFLLNRAYFLRDHNLTTSALSRTRGALCEILATRTLRAHATNMLELALALTTSWPVYSGADPELIAHAREERDDDLEDRVGNAIEVAIVGQAKMFIKSSACQKSISSGKIVYQADSSRSILSDNYKRNPVHFYDPHKAPLLDHYRFLILFILFVFALEFNQIDKLNSAEALFMIYALGFTLEKVAAMQEHGIKVYFKGTWNGFDLAFSGFHMLARLCVANSLSVTLFCTYAVLRLYGIYHYQYWARRTGIDFLAVIAVFMFPRLAFVTLRNNLMVLALRAMLVQFVALMLIAAFCFAGFLYALWTYSVGQIAWWMADLFFGLDASGFDRATEFHSIFGPCIMITYTCLSNTLLLTILVSILSHTFTTISDDAAAEAMFRRAVSTIEGVKADSLFSYQPPINLIALCIMLPSSYILTPRWFHKVNVFMIRLTSFPVLLLIAVYERQAKSSGALTFYETVSSVAEKVMDTLPRSLKRMSFLEGLAGTEADIDAIFELEREPPEDEEDSALDMEDSVIPAIDIRARRLSTVSRRRPSLSVGSAPSPPASPHKREAAAPSAQPGASSTHPAPATAPPPRRGVHAAGTGVSVRRPPMAPARPALPLSASPDTGTGISVSVSEADEDALDDADSAGPSETAGQITEEDAQGEGLLERRLGQMEERQKRIENLLVNLVANLPRR